MPIIRVENAGTLTKEQKRLLIEEISKDVAKITGKPIEAVLVKIEEVPRENMGRGGKPLE